MGRWDPILNTMGCEFYLSSGLKAQRRWWHSSKLRSKWMEAWRQKGLQGHRSPVLRVRTEHMVLALRSNQAQAMEQSLTWPEA